MFMPLTRRLTIVIFKAQHLRPVKEGFPGQSNFERYDFFLNDPLHLVQLYYFGALYEQEEWTGGFKYRS